VKYYEYRHIVGLEETNVVGNVYYVHHLKWQGRCRELFLRERAPEILRQLSEGLALATVRCSCEYFAELEAFDEIAVCMRLTELAASRISLAYDYYRRGPDGDQLIARGQQQIACMRRVDGAVKPTPVPASLRAALEPYREIGRK
jgi:enediyne biosynthesis thioesterase